MWTLAVATALGAVVEVPFRRRVDGLIVVDVGIHGHAPGPFVLDTGASHSAIASRAWVAAGQDPDLGITIGVEAANGRVPVKLATGVRFALGALDARAALVAVLDLGAADIDGVIGRDVLKHYVVEVDPTASVVRFHPPRTDVDVGGVTVRTRRLRGGLHGVPLSVGDGVAMALVDLGAAGTILDPTAAALPGVVPVPGCRGAMSGADLRPSAMGCARAEIGLPGVSFGTWTVWTGQVGALAKLRLGDGPRAVLGVDLLTARPLVFDDRRRRLTFGPPT